MPGRRTLLWILAGALRVPLLAPALVRAQGGRAVNPLQFLPGSAC